MALKIKSGLMRAIKVQSLHLRSRNSGVAQYSHVEAGKRAKGLEARAGH